MDHPNEVRDIFHTKNKTTFQELYLVILAFLEGSLCRVREEKNEAVFKLFSFIPEFGTHIFLGVYSHWVMSASLIGTMKGSGLPNENCELLCEKCISPNDRHMGRKE